MSMENWNTSTLATPPLEESSSIVPSIEAGDNSENSIQQMLEDAKDPEKSNSIAVGLLEKNQEYILIANINNFVSLSQNVAIKLAEKDGVSFVFRNINSFEIDDPNTLLMKGIESESLRNLPEAVSFIKDNKEKLDLGALCEWGLDWGGDINLLTSLVKDLSPEQNNKIAKELESREKWDTLADCFINMKEADHSAILDTILLNGKKSNTDHLKTVDLYGPSDQLTANMRDRIEMFRHDEVKLNNLIGSAPHLGFSQPDPEQAPFKNYQENSSVATQYVADEQVRKYLSNKYFNPIEVLQDSVLEEYRIDSSKLDTPIEVPLDLIVSATGFVSWLGREDGHSKRMSSKFFKKGEDVSSLDAIKHYASLQTDLPSVTNMIMYSQPNGKMFFENDSDSHRIGAAILRGQKTIGAKNITVCKLNKNFID